MFRIKKRFGKWDVEQATTQSQRSKTGVVPCEEGAFKKAPRVAPQCDVDMMETSGRSRLHTILLHGEDTDTSLEKLLKSGCDINARDRYGCRPLHVVADRGHIKRMEMLIKYGAQVEVFNDSGHTPLVIAIRMGHIDAMKCLINAGADVNTPNDRNEVAVHFAALCGREVFFTLLLNNGAKIDIQDDNGNTALIIAARNGDEAMVDLILGNGGSANISDMVGRQALHYAAYYGTAGMVQSLLQAGAHINVTDLEGDQAFTAAIKANNASTLKTLLKAGCDLYNMDGLNMTAMGMAVQRGHASCVKELLDHGEDPDEVSSFGMTALTMSAYRSNLDVIAILLDAGADTNAQGRNGVTPLIMALMQINSENVHVRHDIIRLLLKSNADPRHRVKSIGFFTICNSNGLNCPISFAIGSGYVSLMHMMLLAGSDVSYFDIRHWLTSDNFIGCDCAVHSYFDKEEIIQPIKDWCTQPKPLKHMCRCVIRNSFGSKVRSKLKKLPLAIPLIHYLDLAELDQIQIETFSRVSHFENAGPIVRAYSLYPLEATIERFFF